MIWSYFQQAVFNLMGPDGIRRGITGMVDQNMRNGIVDLQRAIPSFRTGNVTLFNAANLTVESQAMVGAMPAGAKAKAFYIYSTGPNDDPNCKRYKLDFYPWDRRQDIICGQLDWKTWWGSCFCGPNSPSPPCPPPVPPVPNPANPNPWSWCEERAYVYSISPHLGSFVIYPSLNAYMTLELVWDGYKVVWGANDICPFPEEASEAVAQYALSKVRSQIDKDRGLAQDAWGAYLIAKRALTREYRDNLVTDGQDEEYLSNLVSPPGESLISAGAIAVAYLQNITALTGVAPNFLSAISTLNLQPNIPVVFYLNGLEVNYTLRAGTDATSGDGSVVRPNDFDAVANAKVWYSDIG